MRPARKSSWPIAGNPGNHEEPDYPFKLLRRLPWYNSFPISIPHFTIQPTFDSAPISQLARVQKLIDLSTAQLDGKETPSSR